MKLILDTSVLIAFFEELKRPDILFKSKFSLNIPNPVFLEIKKGRTFEKIKPHIESEIRVLEKGDEKMFEEIKNRYPFLGNGEVGVIVDGIAHRDRKLEYLCIIDDKQGRKVAEKFSLKFCGTIGLLRLLKTSGIIDDIELNSLIKILNQSAFRS